MAGSPFFCEFATALSSWALGLRRLFTAYASTLEMICSLSFEDMIDIEFWIQMKVLS